MPVLALCLGDGLDVGNVAGAERDAAVLDAHDARRGDELAWRDHQRLAQKRLDVGKRYGGHGLRCKRRSKHLRRQLHGLNPQQAEADRRGRFVEHEHVARINAMGIFDLVLVHPPQFAPLPRAFQEAAGAAATQQYNIISDIIDLTIAPLTLVAGLGQAVWPEPAQMLHISLNFPPSLLNLQDLCPYFPSCSTPIQGSTPWLRR